MAFRQSTLNFGQRPVLGKRSREPLAELPTNVPVKRSKPAPDLHPGEDQDKPSADEASSDFKRDLEDNVAIEVFDVEDEEEDVAADSTKEADQKRQLDDWFRYCERADKMSALYPEERRRRIECCHDRYAFMLGSIVKKALATNRADVFNKETRDDVPFTFAWWTFLVTISVEKAMVPLMASLPDAVKVILGGPLTTRELLKLPARWKGLNLWAVYGDFLLGQEETGRYCGSRTNALEGVVARLRDYENIVTRKKTSDGLKHGDWLIRARNSEVTMNLRVLAVFDQCKTTKPYVLLMELLTTILLQTLPDAAGSGPYRSTSVVGMLRDATPRDLPEVRHTRLNGAAQCRQGLCGKRTTLAKVCAVCKTTANSVGNHWNSAEPGLPFSGLICGPCHSYRRNNNGNDRPVEFETRRLHVLELRSGVGPKPAAGTACPGCSCVPGDGMWLLPKGNHATEPDRERWECRNYAHKATIELGRKKKNAPPKGSARADLLEGLPDKPAAGTPCPGCDRPDPKGWLLPKGDLANEPGRYRWECGTCYAKQTSKLGDRRKQKPRK